MKEKKFQAGALKRLGVVVVILLGLITFVVMGWLSYKGVMGFDFVIAWAAFWGVVGGIISWSYTNSARLSDARKEKLADLAAEIIEKTHQAHRAIKSIASELSFSGEIEQAREKYGIQQSDKEGERKEKDKYDEQGLVFRYRYEQMEEIFKQYWGLDIKARIYFGNEAEKVIQDFKSIINSVGVGISRINRYHGPDEDRARAREEIKESIWALSAGEISFEGREAKEATERLEKFKNIPDRIEKALSSYVQEDQATV